MLTVPCLALCAQSMFLTGFLARTIPFFRDRILADKMFLFKVGVEIVIDSGEALVLMGRPRDLLSCDSGLGFIMARYAVVGPPPSFC